VHALRHVHRLLVPGGTLVDLHPVTEERLEASGRSLGVLEETEWLTVDLPNSEACVAAAIREGLYTLEAETEFELLQHFDSAEDVLDAKSEILSEDQVKAIRSATPPFLTREDFVLRRLLAQEPGTRKVGPP
jgi:hypothetical protein